MIATVIGTGETFVPRKFASIYRPGEVALRTTLFYPPSVRRRRFVFISPRVKSPAVVFVLYPHPGDHLVFAVFGATVMVITNAFRTQNTVSVLIIIKGKKHVRTTRNNTRTALQLVDGSVRACLYMRVCVKTRNLRDERIRDFIVAGRIM